MCHVQARYATRDAYCPVANEAQPADRRSIGIQIHVPMCGSRRCFAEVQGVHGPMLIAHHHQAASADVARPRCHHGQCPVYGHGCIDGIAAILKHRDPDRCGQGMCTYDHGTISDHAHRGATSTGWIIHRSSPTHSGG